MAPASDSSDPLDPREQYPAGSPCLTRFDGSAPVWLVALAGGIFLAGASVWADRKNRSSRETILQPTAVGDAAWFKKEAGAKTPLLLGGEPLRETTGEEESLSEARMRRAGETDDGAVRLYVPEERTNGAAETGGPSWFVKTGTNRFLRLTR